MSPPDLSPAIYSPSQLETYLAFINLREPYRTSPLRWDQRVARREELGLPFLSALMRFHLAKVPFENLVLHYSPCKEAVLEANELFDRIITTNRGGHCLQLNAFFATVLRSLGFETMTSAAKVNTDCQAVAANPGYDGPSYNGW